MDGEYFNRYGYDIHGVNYIDKLDYIPGPTWIEELGCYPEDKDKYLKEEDLNEDDEDMKDIDMDNIEGDEDLINDMKMLKVNEDIKEEKKSKKENNKKNENKKKKNKKKKEESFDEDEWEEIED